MKALVLFLLWLPLVTCCQVNGPAVNDNRSDTGWIYSALWGKNGELWNRQRLPDFTHAGYGENRVPLPNFPVMEDITKYGGKGDGITDNTKALRTALQHCGAKGAVYIPAGNYHFKDSIVIRKSGLWVRGAGGNSTKIKN